MAVAHVQDVANRKQDAGHTSNPVSITGVASGNLLCAFVYCANETTITVSDGTNTWVEAVTRADATGDEQWSILYAKNVSAGDFTVTASWTGNAGNSCIVVHEVSGCDTTTPLNASVAPVYQESPGTGTDAVTTGNMTTDANGCYIFGGTVNQFQGQNYSAGTGYTAGESAGSSLTPSYMSEYKTQTSAGAVAATWTASTGGGRMCSAAAAFKPAGGGASVEGGGMLLGSRRNRLTIP